MPVSELDQRRVAAIKSARQSLTPTERRTVNGLAHQLQADQETGIEDVGRQTAMEIIWPLGRAMARKEIGV